MSQRNPTTQHAHTEQSPPPETPRELVLGDPLDQMLHARCRYPFQFFGSPAECPRHGGLVLPTPSDPGTGNIVIRGRPGTGKSTLALQIAAEAVRRNDGIYAAYFSLEENQAQVFRKAVNCGWSPYVWPVNRVFEAEYRPPVDGLADDLAKILDDPMACHTCGDTVDIEKRGKDCPATHSPRLPCPFLDRCRTAADDIERAASAEFTAFPGKVILPQLEPRAFSPDAANVADDSLFWTRYRQIDNLLHAAKKLRTESRDRGGDAREPPRAEDQARDLALPYARLRARLGELLSSVARQIQACAECPHRAAHMRRVCADRCRKVWEDALEMMRPRMESLLAAIREVRTPTGADGAEIAERIARARQELDRFQRDADHGTLPLQHVYHQLSRLCSARPRYVSCGSVSPSAQRVVPHRVSTKVPGRQRRPGSSRAFRPVRGARRRIVKTLPPLGFGRPRLPFCGRQVPLREGLRPEETHHWPSGPFDKSLAVVCIDSLNVLGTGGLTRDHLAALFDLFKRRQVIGVFVVEENERGLFAGDSPIDSDTIDFLADVVIELTETEEHGYYVRHFQVAKSRYQKHVLGKHPYKIEGTKKGGDER